MNLFTKHAKLNQFSFNMSSSVADPEPDPDVFGPPGSGSISMRQESGSGSFYQANIVKKTLISTVSDFFMTFYL
jgi:hypothetical protein